jgi:hypothetical protein
MDLMRNLAVLALLLPVLSCGTEAPAAPETAARVFFVAPADGAVVGDTVHLQLGAEGITIVAATGQRVEGEAHHHLFIDSDPTPDSVMIGRDDLTRHLGTGADTVSLVLSPGSHRIIAVAAWGDHFPVVGAGRDTLTIEVPAPVITP